METSSWVDWHWIVSLDQAVWELRRFCTLDPSATSTKLLEGQWAPRVRIVGGHLEKILKKREIPAREPSCGTTGTSVAGGAMSWFAEALPPRTRHYYTPLSYSTRP